MDSINFQHIEKRTLHPPLNLHPLLPVSMVSDTAVPTTIMKLSRLIQAPNISLYYDRQSMLLNSHTSDYELQRSEP